MRPRPSIALPVGALWIGLVASTGHACAAGSEREIITPEWLARYDGPDHLFDRAQATTACPGWIYVTGESDSDTGQEDLFVVKYTTGGSPAWSARYNGPGNGVDRGLDIAVDRAGAVYVTGQSWGGDITEYDFVTVKYSADGAEQWVARYDGEYHGWERGMGVALDSQGGVFVTGWSSIGYDPVYGDETEYVTIKYDSDGNQQWLSGYTGPGPADLDRAYDIAVDAGRDAYVTGSSYSLGHGWDFGTVKYRGSDGFQLWERRYDYGVGGIDEGYAIAVGEHQEVCVTGMSYTNPFVGILVDALTIEYDSDGALQWVARHNGSANSIDNGKDIAVDGAGNVYIVGQSTGQGTGSDYLTIRYTPQGQEAWVSLYNGPMNAGDYGMHLAVDPDHNVYVTGESNYSNTYTDVVTLKYDPEGNEAWLAVHGTPMNTNDFAAGIVLTGGTGVHVTGTSSYVSQGTSWDAVTLSYPTGEMSDVAVPAGEASLRLGPACPNPFAAGTTLEFKLNEAGPARLEVFDAAGRIVRVLVDAELSAGRHRITWDGTGTAGRRLAPGVYFCRLGQGGRSSVMRVTGTR